MDKTKEPQYQDLLDLRKGKGLVRLGLHANQMWHDDPRRMLIMLSRYKFIGKMLAGKKKTVEIGCGDAFGTRLVLQEVDELTAVDFDPVFIEDVKERMDPDWKVDAKVHDILSGPVPDGPFDAAYSLDVLEHIPKADEHKYMDNIMRSLTPHGMVIIGIPSRQSQQYASPRSRDGHVNCKDDKEFRALIEERFRHCFLFSMNDEVVHTGFYPMAHYLLAIGVERRD